MARAKQRNVHIDRMGQAHRRSAAIDESEERRPTKSSPISIAHTAKSAYKKSCLSVESQKYRGQQHSHRLQAFQNLPNRGQMKVHRLPYHRDASVR